LQQELPPLTCVMIQLSDFFRSFAMVYVLGGLGIICFVVYYYFRNASKKLCDNIVARVPFIGVVVWQYHMSQALQALSLLVNSGIILVTALKIVSDSVDHSTVKAQFAALYDDVASGQLLSNAMAIMAVFLPEVIALVHIGEETGTLGESLERAALTYNDRLDEQLRRFVFFLQPAVIILLGFLVTTLIFAVYLPIMQLSHAL
jgi:type II secretory pathway component PulF